MRRDDAASEVITEACQLLVENYFQNPSSALGCLGRKNKWVNKLLGLVEAVLLKFILQPRSYYCASVWFEVFINKLPDHLIEIGINGELSVLPRCAPSLPLWSIGNFRKHLRIEFIEVKMRYHLILVYGRVHNRIILVNRYCELLLLMFSGLKTNITQVLTRCMLVFLFVKY